MAKPRQSQVPAAELLYEKLTDRLWRLCNLYQIYDKEGNLVPFVPNKVQMRIFNEMHTRNFVPKARQLGVSTAIVLYFLDACIWAHADNPCRAANIDFKEADAFAKLNIARTAWRKGPEHPNAMIAGIWKTLQARNAMIVDNSGELGWENGSSQQAGTSVMGNTVRLLHVSELGPLAAQRPVDAQKIVRGSFNAVPANGLIVIETTMEGGTFGECAAIFNLAWKNEGRKDLAPLEWKMFFFPWHMLEEYKLAGRAPRSEETAEYFRRLNLSEGVKVTAEQAAWYEMTKLTQRSNIYTQYPSVISECLFAGNNTGFFDADALQWMRNQITPLETQIEYGDIVVQGEMTDLQSRTASFVVKSPEVSPFQIIERPMEGRRYLLFADSCVGKQAEGSDDAKRDTHSYGVIRDEYIDPVTRERFLPQIVALCRDDDRCITPEMIRRVVRLSIYYGDCIVVPEINNKDDLATRMIAAGVKNMYVQGLVGADDAMPGTKKTTQVFGWLTTEGTRRQMLDHMREETLQQRWICSFGVVLQQMSVFIINKNGRAEAAPTEHDDHVVGPCIGLFNLPHATKYVGREERIVMTYQQDWNAIYADPTGI